MKKLSTSLKNDSGTTNQLLSPSDHMVILHAGLETNKVLPHWKLSMQDNCGQVGVRSPAAPPSKVPGSGLGPWALAPCLFRVLLTIAGRQRTHLRLLCIQVPCTEEEEIHSDFQDLKLSHLAERDVPLELERELFSLAGCLVLGADQHVVEEEEVAQLPGALGELHGEGILDQVPLLTFLVRVQLPPVLHVVLVEERLDHVKRLREGGTVRMIRRGVLDQVLQAETVLLHPRHRLVQQVLQGQTLTLLLAFEGPELDAAREVGELGVELGAPVQGGQGSRVVAQELGVHLMMMMMMMMW